MTHGLNSFTNISHRGANGLNLFTNISHCGALNEICVEFSSSLMPTRIRTLICLSCRGL